MLALLAYFAITSMRDCGNGLGRASNLTFNSQPANPVAGDNVTLWVAYSITTPPITGGTATYAIALNGIPIPPTTKPLGGETTLPKQVGFNNETSWSLFPSGISGKVVSSITWKDQNGDLVWCVENTWRV